jgi:hypothetical protein
MTTNDEPPEWDERTFLSLADLIGIGKRVSTLAEAIERHGVQGWDRYGRFKTFKPSDPEAKNGLDFLARQYEWNCNGGNCQEDSCSPSDDYEGEGQTLGWYDDEHPDFEAIAAEKTGENPPRPKGKTGYRPDAMHGIIGGLLMFIRGELDGEKKQHPAYKSQEDLARLLADELKGYPGLSLRNIQDKFATANRAIDQPN